MRTRAGRARRTHGRAGFKELVADVGLGNVGLILALEVSRFARSSADWHQLIDLCALTGTLIADSDGIYAPGDFNDRLLLGLKGTMSEAELHLIRARLTGGLRNKAARGELVMHLPAGFDRDEDDRIVLCADEQVRHAIARVFEVWRRAGSARQVVGELIADGQLLPRRSVGERRVRWVRASYGAVHKLLTNPVYAGAFVFGRTRQEKHVDANGQLHVKTIEVPMEEWSVCMPDHHPGYVTWEEYLANRERLRGNVRPRGEGGGAAREGGALLQGLLRCGRCGRRMQVAYSGNDGHRVRYACVRGFHLHGTDSTCQTLGGGRLDRAVAAAFLEAVTPAGVAASTGAIAELTEQHDARLAGQRLAVERAEIDAQRAERQFDACEPENRLVARTLERKLEDALAGVAREQRTLAALEHARPAPLTPAERDALTRLARDLPKLWAANTTTDRDRKELLRALISEVVVTVSRPENIAEVEIFWEGGARSELSVRLIRARHEANLHIGGHDRADPPARRASPRPSDRRDPEPARPEHRHRAAVHRHTRPRRSSASRASRSHPSPSRTARPSRSSRPPPRCRCRPRRSIGGCAKGCCPASKSRRARRGGSGSRTRSAASSCPTSRTATSRSTRPRNASASPARPCCTRSNADSDTRCTSPPAVAKA